MANRSTPLGNRFSGWFSDNSTTATPVQKFYNRGTLVFTVTAAATITAGKLTAATGETTGDHTFLSTITAGGVGSDGQQLTSGGAGSVCDWSASGV